MKHATVLLALVILSACEWRPSAPAVPAASDVDPPTVIAKLASDSPEKTPYGTIAGRVIYKGPPPKSRTMYVIEAGNLEAHTIITDPQTGGLKNAVVWVEAVPARTPLAELPLAIQDQNNWTFVPHVLAVRARQKVRFVNRDRSNHNVHSYAPGAEFNFATPASNDYEVVYRFRRPTGTSPVKLSCDTHTWMRGWVYVFEHDAYDVTDESGAFRLAQVPAGTHRLRVHHADGSLEETHEVVVEGDGETTVELTISS